MLKPRGMSKISSKGLALTRLSIKNKCFFRKIQ